MNVLGVFHSFSDPSAAILVGDRIVAFAEEDRFLRCKHAEGRFPIRSIEYVLREAGLRLDLGSCLLTK